MKTTKLTVLLLLLIAAIGGAKAQCNAPVAHSSHGGDYYFYAYAHIDSNEQFHYWWDFGDGDTAHALYPKHTFSANGTYIACFNFESTSCPLTSTCDTVTVDLCEFNPIIHYTVSGFSATYKPYFAPAGSTYFWQFDTPGGPQTSTDTMPVINYGQFGFYDAHVTITAPGGCVDTAVIQAAVFAPCNANFTYEQTGLYEITFRAEDSLNVGSYISFQWQYFNGAGQMGGQWSHTYWDTFTDHVCLSVIDTGCAATVCHDVVIGPPGVPVHYITGAVTTGTDTACSAVVYLISDSAGFLSLTAVTHTVDSLGMCDGFYYFPNIPQGNYYVKAALDSVDPDYANYLPTYYGNELNWGDATQLALTSHTHVNINLVAGVNPGGPGFIGGWVFEGAGLAIGGDYNESRGAGDPIAGIQINLLTQNNIPVAATYTNASGRYTFSNLALGTYKIYAEQINKVPYAMNVTLDANNQLQDNVNVAVNSNSAVTGIDDMLDIRVAGVYPNPVADKTSVTVTMKQSTKVTMTLTDVNGHTIQSRNLELATGTNEIKLDMNGEATGVYHLNLTNDNNKKIIRLIKIN